MADLAFHASDFFGIDTLIIEPDAQLDKFF